MTALQAPHETTRTARSHAPATRAQPTLAGRPADECRIVNAILSRIGDKWTVLVVMLLGPGPLRFNEIRRQVGGISQRMLTLTLRGLERDGLVTRTVTPSNPPRVDYELSALGHSLSGAVRSLGTWARDNRAEVEQARAAFDARGT